MDDARGQPPHYVDFLELLQLCFEALALRNVTTDDKETALTVLSR